MPASRSSYLTAANRTELPALTGLRIVAALLVVCWHAAGFLPSLPPLINHGYIGVDLFFVLSGFIISHVYWREFQHPTQRLYLRFIALRLARLWPAHIAVVLAFLASLGLVAAVRDQSLPWSEFGRELIQHLFLAHNWGLIPSPQINFPSWSVSAEFLAYLAFPLQVALFSRLRSTAALIAAVPVALLLCWLGLRVIFDAPLGSFGPLGNIRVLCEFAMGVAVYRLWAEQRLPRLPWTAIVALCAIAIVAIAALTPTWHDFIYGAVLLMPLLILGLAQADGVFVRLFSSRAMVYLGEISYSVYLVHALATGAVQSLVTRLAPAMGFKPEPWLIIVLVIVLALIGGAVLFHVVEKPARNWLRRRIDRHLPAPQISATV